MQSSLSKYILIICATASYTSWANPRQQREQSANGRSSRTVPMRQQEPVGVREAFNNAMKLNQAGKVDEAIMAFEAILRRFNGHQPSLIQYGRLLYSRDRIPEAYQAFARVNPIGLDPDISYEYALSHFWMRQYESALTGFKRIPDGHALFDLANYYGAVSALKVRRLVEAEAMMEKAVVLPDQLAKSRRNYLQHIQALKLLEERQGLAQERERERQRIEDEIKKEGDKKITYKQTEQIKKYMHRGFEEVNLGADLGVKFKQQVNDKHGFSEETATIMNTYFDFNGGFLLPLPFKIKRNQAAFGLQLSGLVEEEQRRGKEVRNIESEDLEGIERISNTSDKSVTKFGAVKVGAWIESPTPAKIWLALGGVLMQKFPEFEAKKRSSIYEGYLQLGSKEYGREYSARYTYGQITNQRNEHSTTAHKLNFLWHFPLLLKLDLDVEVAHKIYDYVDETVDGPSSVTDLSFDLFYNLPLGFTLGSKISGSYQSDFLYHNLPTYGEVSADGQTVTGRAYVTFEPISWFAMEISQQISKTTWVIEREEAKQTFQQNYPDYQEEFQAKASLNLLF